MSTLYRRPPTEDPSAYASAEALIEIEKRVVHSSQGSVASPGRDAADDPVIPTVVLQHTVGPEPPGGTLIPTAGLIPTVNIAPNKADAPVLSQHHTSRTATIPTVGLEPPVGPIPTGGIGPTGDSIAKRRVKPIRDVQDALTLAGQILYRAMLGSPDGTNSNTCTKGYRQLAAETRLDKDTVRDLIVEFKQKGIVRETATYDPDTRSAKTYEVLSPETILQIWRDAGLLYVTTGRQRPQFCQIQAH